MELLQRVQRFFVTSGIGYPAVVDTQKNGFFLCCIEGELPLENVKCNNDVIISFNLLKTQLTYLHSLVPPHYSAHLFILFTYLYSFESLHNYNAAYYYFILKTKTGTLKDRQHRNYVDTIKFR